MGALRRNSIGTEPLRAERRRCFSCGDSELICHDTEPYLEDHTGIRGGVKEMTRMIEHRGRARWYLSGIET